MIKLKVREVMEKKGKTEEDLLANINRLTVKYLFSDILKRIDFSTLDKLCKTLECTPGELLVYEEERE